MKEPQEDYFIKNNFRLIQKALTPDLLKPRWRKQKNRLYGHCYVASEALYHLLGRENYQPFFAKYEDEMGDSTHWWLMNKKTGQILDPTKEQFLPNMPPYELGRKAVFLTKLPSKRAKIVIDRVKSGYNINGNISLFQSENSGSSPTYPHNYRIGKCEFSEIIKIFQEFHYKGGNMGGGVSFCLGLVDVNGRVVGGAVIGKPRHQDKYGGSVEIRRMACLDECPKNTESFFLSKIIWYIKKNTDFDSILSYADTSVGHKGIIYKASNFKLVGQTAESKHVFWKGVRYHPRSLNTERPYSHKLREALKNGEAFLETGPPKNIFIYKIKNSPQPPSPRS